MSLGEGRETGRRGDRGTGRPFCRRAALSPCRRFSFFCRPLSWRRRRVPVSPRPRVFSSRFPLRYRNLKLLACLLERAALIKGAAEVAMSFSVVAFAKIERSLKLMNRFFELPSPVKHQPEIVMSIRRSVALRDCLLQHIGRAVKIAQSRKRVSEIAMRVRKVAALLLDRRLVSSHRLLDFASSVKGIAQIVVSFGISAIALPNRRSIRRNGFVDFAQVIESHSEVLPGRGEPV